MLLNCNTCTLIAFICIPLCVCVCFTGPCRWDVGAGHSPLPEHLPHLWPWQAGVFVEHRGTQAGLVHHPRGEIPEFQPSFFVCALFISIRDLLQGSLLHNSEFFPVSLAGVRPVCWFLPQWIGGVSRPQYRTVSQSSSSCISELNAEKSNKLSKHFSVLLHPQALDIETFWRIFTTMDLKSKQWRCDWNADFQL